MLLAMSVCHTLGTSADGSLVGNQVDKVSFETSGASMHQAKDQLTRVTFRNRDYKVLKHFEFDCHRTTQSVIIENDKGEKMVFVKGSSDSIQKICEPSSLPESFAHTVKESAKNGIYQISIATRLFDNDVSVAEANRDDIEKSLRFVGFVSFQNRE